MTESQLTFSMVKNWKHFQDQEEKKDVFFHYYYSTEFGSPIHSNQRRKKKEFKTGKEEVKLSLFADDMILYLENPKDTTTKLVNFGKDAGYKINTKTSIAFLCNNNERSE